METVNLPCSKSILNRYLLLTALSGRVPSVLPPNLPHDAAIMQHLLFEQQTEIYDVEDAGTVFRFLTAYLCITPGTHRLEGTEALNNRPIKPLVEVLKALGADIQYQKEEGKAPLLITGKKIAGGVITIDASLSSQFVSALMLVSPAFESGITLNLLNVTSKPYILITANCLQNFGIKSILTENSITIEGGQQLHPNEDVFDTIETDWSSAAFWYALCAVSKKSFFLKHLTFNSIQGDKVAAAIFSELGVKSISHENGIEISYSAYHPKLLVFDVKDCPDLAPALIVACAMQGRTARFLGMETLKNKESDRTGALQTELQRFCIDFTPEENYWQLHGSIVPSPVKEMPLLLNTYNDHRMAMAFSCLKLKFPWVAIDNPGCVRKSYPAFWKEFERIFSLTPLK